MRWTLPRRSLDGPAATVTVVVPCYRYGHYLPSVVASILEQERVVADVVIVDDASPDGSADVAEAIAAADPRVRTVRHAVNKGHIATYNDGLALVKGEFAVLLSADDLLPPGALARATDLMRRYPRVGMVYGFPKSFGDPEPPPVRRRWETWTVWPGQQWIDLAAWRGQNFIMSPEVVVRSSVLRGVGGYNPKLPHSGDLEYWLRVASVADVGRVNGPTQAFYRVHGANMHLTSFATMIVDLQHRLAAFEVLTELDNGRRTAAERLRWVRRAMAREALALGERGLDRGGQIDTAREFLRFATSTLPESAGWRRAQNLARRTRSGVARTTTSRARELARRQYDRVSWRLWARAGVQ